jgi:hypothetical protein
MAQDVLQQHLAQAERHMAQGVVHLARQRALITELDRAGHNTEEARAILESLMETQLLHQQDRERLLRLASQREDRATAERPKAYRPANIRREDAQRWTRLREMEQQAIELLRHSAPDTFLGRQHSAPPMPHRCNAQGGIGETKETAS